MDESDHHRIAVYIDLENVAIGVRDAGYDRLDARLVFERLLDKGDIVSRRAYANWEAFSEYRRPLHEAGCELIELPGSKLTGKNSADIKMVVDALELSYTKPHIDTFAFITGDSDFYPLISKLRENGKHTVAVGVKQSTSKLLIDVCDEFVFYDDLVRHTKKKKARSGRGAKVDPAREAFDLIVEAVSALERENKVAHSSLVKETIRRKQPQFNEEYHGYRSFNRLLEDAAKNGVIEIQRDDRSGTYVIARVLEES
jgi:uncharacterized protein (TIGR00288 family)